MISALLRLDHVPAIAEVGLIFMAVEAGLLIAGLSWLVYVALEPYVRRLWPDALFSWSRLLAGRLQDPRIGRDILAGGLAGVAFWVGSDLFRLLWSWLGFPALPPLATNLNALRGLRQATSMLFLLQMNVLLLPMFLLLAVLLVRVLLLRQWAAVGLATLIFATLDAIQVMGSGMGGSGPIWLQIAVVGLASAAMLTLLMFVMIRLGLLALMLAVLFTNLRFWYPLTLDPSAFYAGRSQFVLMLVAALVLYGFTISRGGRRLLREELLPQ